MKVVVINLDRDIAKLQAIDAQLKRRGILYERVAAVYGKDMPTGEFRATYDSFRWWCAIGRPIVPAEVGCALSHYGIYRSLKPGDVVCILEDDVILDVEFTNRLAEVEDFVDAGKPQVVMLSSHRCHRPGNGITRSYSAMCTDGYVITYPAAIALLAANLPMIVPCDHWWRWIQQGRIELYHALPAVVRQDQETFGTSTQANAVLVRDYSLPRLIFHKFKRVVGKSLDACLTAVTGR